MFYWFYPGRVVRRRYCRFHHKGNLVTTVDGFMGRRIELEGPALARDKPVDEVCNRVALEVPPGLAVPGGFDLAPFGAEVLDSLGKQ